MALGRGRARRAYNAACARTWSGKHYYYHYRNLYEAIFQSTLVWVPYCYIDIIFGWVLLRISIEGIIEVLAR